MTTVFRIVLLIVAALACHLLLRALHPVLVRYALARPNARSSHRVPTPQGAGMAVVAVALGGTGLAWTVGLVTSVRTAELFVLGAGAVALAIMGAVDDIRGVAPLPRLLLQVTAVAGLVATMPEGEQVVPVVPLFVDRAVVLLGGVWFVNLVNFMDGIDWISVAEVVPVCAGIAIAGGLGAVPPMQAAAAIALGGAMIGFAPANKPVAKVFLGDVGSVPIGLLLVWMLVSLAAHGHLVAALLLPLYYLADATITLLRRLARRERVWEAHRQHFYQRSVDRGRPVLGTVRDVFVVNLALVALATVSIVAPALASQGITLLLGCAAVAGLLARLARGAS